MRGMLSTYASPPLSPDGSPSSSPPLEFGLPSKAARAVVIVDEDDQSRESRWRVHGVSARQAGVRHTHHARDERAVFGEAHRSKDERSRSESAQHSLATEDICHREARDAESSQVLIEKPQGPSADCIENWSLDAVEFDDDYDDYDGCGDSYRYEDKYEDDVCEEPYVLPYEEGFASNGNGRSGWQLHADSVPACEYTYADGTADLILFEY